MLYNKRNLKNQIYSDIFINFDESLNCYSAATEKVAGHVEGWTGLREIRCGTGNIDNWPSKPLRIDGGIQNNDNSKQTVWKQKNGHKNSYNADYSKLLINVDYLANNMFGAANLEASKEDNDTEGGGAGEGAGGGGLRVGPVLDKLFSDIATCFGGAVQMRAIADADPKVKKV